MSQKVQFTILLLDDNDLPFAVAELSAPEPGITQAQTYLQEGVHPREIGALLMCAASGLVEPHQRVKLLAIIAEISRAQDFDDLAAWNPLKH